MSTLINGLNFLISHVRREVFTFRWESNEQQFLDKVLVVVVVVVRAFTPAGLIG